MGSRQMLSCQEMTDLVTDYLEGRLKLQDRVRFQLHIGMCRHCRAFLRARKMTIKTVGKLPVEPIADDVRDELLERFKNWKRD